MICGQNFIGEDKTLQKHFVWFLGKYFHDVFWLDENSRLLTCEVKCIANLQTNLNWNVLNVEKSITVLTKQISTEKVSSVTFDSLNFYFSVSEVSTEFFIQKLPSDSNATGRKLSSFHQVSILIQFKHGKPSLALRIHWPNFRGMCFNRSSWTNPSELWWKLFHSVSVSLFLFISLKKADGKRTR